MVEDTLYYHLMRVVVQEVQADGQAVACQLIPAARQAEAFSILVFALKENWLGNVLGGSCCLIPQIEATPLAQIDKIINMSRPYFFQLTMIKNIHE